MSEIVVKAPADSRTAPKTGLEVLPDYVQRELECIYEDDHQKTGASYGIENLQETFEVNGNNGRKVFFAHHSEPFEGAVDHTIFATQFNGRQFLGWGQISYLERQGISKNAFMEDLPYGSWLEVPENLRRRRDFIQDVGDLMLAMNKVSLKVFSRPLQTGSDLHPALERMAKRALKAGLVIRYRESDLGVETYRFKYPARYRAAGALKHTRMVLAKR